MSQRRFLFIYLRHPSHRAAIDILLVFGMSFAARNDDYILVVHRRRGKIVPFTSQEEQEQPP